VFPLHIAQQYYARNPFTFPTNDSPMPFSEQNFCSSSHHIAPNHMPGFQHNIARRMLTQTYQNLHSRVSKQSNITNTTGPLNLTRLNQDNHKLGLDQYDTLSTHFTPAKVPAFQQMD